MAVWRPWSVASGVRGAARGCRSPGYGREVGGCATRRSRSPPPRARRAVRNRAKTTGGRSIVRFLPRHGSNRTRTVRVGRVCAISYGSLPSPRGRRGHRETPGTAPPTPPRGTTDAAQRRHQRRLRHAARGRPLADALRTPRERSRSAPAQTCGFSSFEQGSGRMDDIAERSRYLVGFFRFTRGVKPEMSQR